MRSQRILLLAAAALFLIGLGLWLARVAPATSHLPANPHTAAQQPAPRGKTSQDPIRTFETLNHNSIEFYGRAVDQFGAPVPGAEVRATILVNTGSRRAETTVRTSTDGSGYFQIRDQKGQDLGLVIHKEGYEYRPAQTSFSFTYFEADHKRHVPDLKMPVTFTLWKKQGPEPLVHYEKVWRFPVNGAPLRLNLATGAVDHPTPDLVVSISRNPLRMRFGERGFSWSASVEVLGGGVIQAGKREYYNLAPDSGYVPKFEFTQPAQSIVEAQAGQTTWTWRESFEDEFFFVTQNGKNYARVSLRLRPNSDRNEGDNEALAAMEVWLNPSGSRNLEYDPGKAIRLPNR